MTKELAFGSAPQAAHFDLRWKGHKFQDCDPFQANTRQAFAERMQTLGVTMPLSAEHREIVERELASFNTAWARYRIEMRLANPQANGREVESEI